MWPQRSTASRRFTYFRTLYIYNFFNLHKILQKYRYKSFFNLIFVIKSDRISDFYQIGYCYRIRICYRIEFIRFVKVRIGSNKIRSDPIVIGSDRIGFDRGLKSDRIEFCKSYQIGSNSDSVRSDPNPIMPTPRRKNLIHVRMI